jgi:hypothetical protein
MKMFRLLDVKCLQLDTLGYLIIDHIIYSANFEQCREIIQESLSFYNNAARDGWCFVEKALDEGNITAFIDIYDLSQRLECSLQRFATSGQNIRLVLLESSAVDALSGIQKQIHSASSYPSKFSDNRDRKILRTIDPAGSLERLVNGLESVNPLLNGFFHRFAHYLSVPRHEALEAPSNNDANDTIFDSLLALLDEHGSQSSVDCGSIVESCINILHSAWNEYEAKTVHDKHVVCYETTTPLFNVIELTRYLWVILRFLMKQAKHSAPFCEVSKRIMIKTVNKLESLHCSHSEQKEYIKRVTQLAMKVGEDGE